jgi:hypothetical protein
MLKEEGQDVDFSKKTDLPGYSLINVDDENGKIQLEYFAAFGSEPYDVVELTELF